MENKKEKTSNAKKASPKFIIGVVSYTILGLYALTLIIGSFIFPETSLFWKSINIFGNSADYITVVRILSYVIFLLGISWVIRFAFKKLSVYLKKGKAVIDITCSLIKYTAVIVLIFFILRTLGVDTTTVLAGIGILGLVVGLGAQPLIADIIAGLFIVFEKIFDVGDIIVVDGFRGTVKEIGIRTTQIIDAGGNIKIINNADLKTIINMTNQLSLAVCDIGIEYGESLERVESILKDKLGEVKDAIPDIKEGPFYKGVAELGDSAVVIRFVAKCDESSKYQVERDMNRQFKLLFDKNNINIPFTQVVVHAPTEFGDATKKQQKAAKTFVDEQKALSKDLGGDNVNHI